MRLHFNGHAGLPSPLLERIISRLIVLVNGNKDGQYVANS